MTASNSKSGSNSGSSKGTAKASGGGKSSGKPQPKITQGSSEQSTEHDPDVKKHNDDMARRTAKQSGEKLEEGAEGQGEKGDEVNKSFWKGESSVISCLGVDDRPLACASWSVPFTAMWMLMCLYIAGSGGRDTEA